MIYFLKYLPNAVKNRGALTKLAKKVIPVAMAIEGAVSNQYEVAEVASEMTSTASTSKQALEASPHRNTLPLRIITGVLGFTIEVPFRIVFGALKGAVATNGMLLRGQDTVSFMSPNVEILFCITRDTVTNAVNV